MQSKTTTVTDVAATRLMVALTDLSRALDSLESKDSGRAAWHLARARESINQYRSMEVGA